MAVYFMGSLHGVSRSMARYRGLRMPNGLNSTHHSLLLVIKRLPGASQDELAAAVCLDKSTVTRALTQLEHRGYITRTPDATDKRRQLIHLTEEALPIVTAMKQIMYDWYDNIAEGIEEKDLEVFRSVLVRMEQNARNTVKKTEATEE